MFCANASYGVETAHPTHNGEIGGYPEELLEEAGCLDSHTPPVEPSA